MMPVPTAKYSVVIFYPETINWPASHQFLFRIIKNIFAPPYNRQLIRDKLELLHRILVRSLGSGTSRVGARAFDHHYHENGEPIDLKFDLMLTPKDPKWSDGIELLKISCALDERRRITFTSKRKPGGRRIYEVDAV